MRQLEAKLRDLLIGEFSSLTLAFNDDHSCNNVKADEWDYDTDNRIDWPSEEEKAKAIQENSVWTLQWYPNTPVGFNCIGASSLVALMEYLPVYLGQEDQ